MVSPNGLHALVVEERWGWEDERNRTSKYRRKEGSRDGTTPVAWNWQPVEDSKRSTLPSFRCATWRRQNSSIARFAFTRHVRRLLNAATPASTAWSRGKVTSQWRPMPPSRFCSDRAPGTEAQQPLEPWRSPPPPGPRPVLTSPTRPMRAASAASIGSPRLTAAPGHGMSPTYARAVNAASITDAHYPQRAAPACRRSRRRRRRDQVARDQELQARAEGCATVLRRSPCAAMLADGQERLVQSRG